MQLNANDERKEEGNMLGLINARFPQWTTDNFNSFDPAIL